MIRQLDFHEIDRILPIIYSDAKAVGIDESRIDKLKLKHTLIGCIENAVILVSERDDVITGIMAMILTQSYWCDDYRLQNLIYYVLPEHRNSTDGIELLKEAKSIADKAGVGMDFYVESYEDNDRKDRVFQRLGFRKIGSSFKYGVT